MVCSSHPAALITAPCALTHAACFTFFFKAGMALSRKTNTEWCDGFPPLTQCFNLHISSSSRRTLKGMNVSAPLRVKKEMTSLQSVDFTANGVVPRLIYKWKAHCNGMINHILMENYFAYFGQSQNEVFMSPNSFWIPAWWSWYSFINTHKSS